MKTFYTMLAAIGVTASMAAQQLPNVGFEDEWTDCIPWTSDGNSTAKGTTPSQWTISHVIGINGLGATAVGSKVDGFKSASAVELKNSPNELLPTQTVPGYITLGTPWSTSVMGSENDGGVFGGIPFTHRPDALMFRQKLLGTENKGSVVAYMWKGTYTQKDVPANIVIWGSPVTVDMVDRDRNILDKETTKGGEVTHTDDAKLIAFIEGDVTEEIGDLEELSPEDEGWDLQEITFTYLSDENPEKINVILSPGEYFNSEVTPDLTLTVDNVMVVYSSRLSTITYKGEEIDGFFNTDFNYEIDDEMPTDVKDFEYPVWGYSGAPKAEIALDPAKSEVRITVSNATGVDYDGKNSHVYTLKFTGGGSSIADTAADAANNVRYYNLQGNIVDADALVSGQTYIKVANGVASKIIK